MTAPDSEFEFAHSLGLPVKQTGIGEKCQEEGQPIVILFEDFTLCPSVPPEVLCSCAEAYDEDSWAAIAKIGARSTRADRAPGISFQSRDSMIGKAQDRLASVAIMLHL